MPALTKERNTPALEITHRLGNPSGLTVLNATTLYRGALLMIDTTTGEVEEGATATGKRGIGRCPKTIDNSADGEVTEVEQGIFKWANSSGADEIGAEHIGADCYIVDDQTVAATDGTSTRSVAGKVFAVESDGVWVKTVI